MAQQSYSNHSRYVPGFHFVAGLSVVAMFLYATVRLVKVTIVGHQRFTHMLYYTIVPFVLALTIVLIWWYTRKFAVTVQNRAIRAEENLRYFILAGKAIDPRITMGQIIALRFAGDDEFVGLVKEAADKNLSGDDIKKAVKNWRTDDYRA